MIITAMRRTLGRRAFTSSRMNQTGMEATVGREAIIWLLIDEVGQTVVAACGRRHLACCPYCRNRRSETAGADKWHPADSAGAVQLDTGLRRPYRPDMTGPGRACPDMRGIRRWLPFWIGWQRSR